MEHRVLLSTDECTELIAALKERIKQDIAEMDRVVDMRIIDRINSTIEIDLSKQEPNKRRNTYAICGDCKYLDLEDRTSAGYSCNHPARNDPGSNFHQSRLAHRKYKSAKACKRYEERQNENND